MDLPLGESLSEFLQRAALAPPLEVSAVGLEADRILAIPITDKRFERFAKEVVLPPHTPETLAFLPYSVILLNNTAREIGRFTVVWEYTDFHGNSINHTASSGNTATLHSGDSILPGVPRLVSIVHRLGMQPGPLASHVAEVWDSWKDFYARQRKVVITVDSVIFRDGQVVGPDSSSSALLTEWTLRGQREVVDEVLGEDNGADLARVGRKLKEVIGQAKPLIASELASGSLNPQTFLRATRRYKTPEQFQLLMRGLAAWQLLDAAENIGMASLVERLAAARSMPPSPDVHG